MWDAPGTVPRPPLNRPPASDTHNGTPQRGPHWPLVEPSFTTASMKNEDYKAMELWPLRSHLIEIQDRIESARLMASAIHQGRVVSPQKSAGEIAAKLVEIVDLIGRVQRQHAPDRPNVAVSHAAQISNEQ